MCLPFWSRVLAFTYSQLSLPAQRFSLVVGFEQNVDNILREATLFRETAREAKVTCFVVT